MHGNYEKVVHVRRYRLLIAAHCPQDGSVAVGFVEDVLHAACEVRLRVEPELVALLVLPAEHVPLHVLDVGRRCPRHPHLGRGGADVDFPAVIPRVEQPVPVPAHVDPDLVDAIHQAVLRHKEVEERLLFWRGCRELRRLTHEEIGPESREHLMPVDDEPNLRAALGTEGLHPFQEHAVMRAVEQRAVLDVRSQPELLALGPELRLDLQWVARQHV